MWRGVAVAKTPRLHGAPLSIAEAQQTTSHANICTIFGISGFGGVVDEGSESDSRGVSRVSAQSIPLASESSEISWSLFGLDRQGWVQALGGIVFSLIALYSSYDHISLRITVIHLAQQWGVWFIIASLAIVLIEFVSYGTPLGRDAQLASGSRLRAAHEAAETRKRQARESERRAEEAERQGQGIALLHNAALLSARVQLDPSKLNRSRLSAFLALLAEQACLDQPGPES
jgi:hypothetical protein